MGRKTIGRFVNTALQVFTIAGKILFNNNTISTGAIGYDGAGGIQLKAPGVYMIYTNFTAIATATDQDVGIAMYEGSNLVGGASGSATMAAVGDYVNIGFNAVVTVRPGVEGRYATLYFNTTGASSITTANVIIEKVA